MRAKMAEMEIVEGNKGKSAVIDASGAVLGRLASHLAKRLLQGETIVVVNAERAFITGHPDAIKARYDFKTTVGTRRKGPFPSRMPHLLFKRTVRGMMPYQRPNGRAALKRLTCHIGTPPELTKQKAERIEDALRPVESGMTLADVSRFLGKNIEVKPSG